MNNSNNSDVSTQQAKSQPIQAWIQALRLRTLPLAASGVLIASAAAHVENAFSWHIFFPMLAMALLLQILANFADEYGDLAHGVDDESRVGPVRGMQRGDITAPQMKVVMGITTIITLALIVYLVLISLTASDMPLVLTFIFLGVISIAASITYTVGPHPYGYFGLGDIMSFVFFGLIAVVGGEYLFTRTLEGATWLPAIGLGCATVAVINCNNMRDNVGDKAKGKHTIANILGDPGMRIYQSVLLIASILLFSLYVITSDAPFAVIPLLIPFFIYMRVLIGTWKVKDYAQLDRFMAPISMGTALGALIFALSLAFLV